MSRHNHDPNYVGHYPIDNVAMSFVGKLAARNCIRKAVSPELPDAVFKAIMTPINEADAPPPGKVGPDGIGNGLYSIHIRMLDGLDGGNTGVMLLQGRQHPRRRCVLRLYRRLFVGERSLEGRDRQPRTHA